MMKFSVFTVMTPEFTPEEIVKKLVKMGFDGIEWRVVTELKEEKGEISFWKNNKCTLSLEDLDKKADYIKKLTQKENLKICNLATYLNTDEFEKIEKAMQVAQIMECPQIRVNVPKYSKRDDYNSLFSLAQANLEKVAKISSKYNVKAVLELHMGNIIPSASAAYRLIAPFDPEHIGVIYDPGNMVYEGYENWRMGMQLLGKYLAHVHVKNSKWIIEKKENDGTFLWRPIWAPLKEGIVNWREVIDDLKSVGYTGYLSFEDFSDIPTEKKLIEDIEYIKKFL